MKIFKWHLRSEPQNLEIVEYKRQNYDVERRNILGKIGAEIVDKLITTYLIKVIDESLKTFYAIVQANRKLINDMLKKT